MNATNGRGSSISASDLLRDIKAVMAEIEAKAPKEPSILGQPIFVDPLLDNVPKMQLTPKVYDNLPSPFRDEINAWMRDFFGTESRMYHAAGIGVLMGPKMLAQVKAHV
ncbi:hypothetical protein [Ralstonia mannitolilytica]|uniref:hypothetical protein n=1 Tax=Ralstonia mannitolilytica TaxID=105219 RepID=UPI003748042B